MTLSLNIGNFFNDSSSHALVDELRKRTSEEDILDFEEKFNSKNEKNLHVYICRFLKNRSISRGLASRWLITIIENKESTINALAFTFIMGFSIFGIALWKLSGLT